MDLGLDGRVVVVGGGSAGLGLATAAACAREGAAVVLGSRSAERVAAAVDAVRRQVPGADVAGVAVDLSQAEGCTGLIDAALARHGGLDSLLLNTGGPPAGRALDADDATWTAAFEAVVLPVVRLARLAVPQMRRRGGGRILGVTSTSVRQPIGDLVLSGALRAAVVGFLKSLADTCAPDGILVNALAPGRFATERITFLDGRRAAESGRSLEAVQAELLEAVPLGRYGDPDEYGRAAAFLLSFANTYITGTHVYCDGGALRTVL